ncbi:PAS domain-containing protein [Tistlia consotensis]|uniref:PAS domain-containing protein n=1 Tax=Tistlia consotensis USBA 355 TaxID=560819 RepID=A0A1Y6B4X9_9PROT|nr:PAS domain-containing protein [Tistlia consotensis]SME90500.1 PAS domain-containing protein [Tistlia consotensis USBA 355]SNR26775.1 PAS domain-containing protein [Tistlia consotensis]
MVAPFSDAPGQVPVVEGKPGDTAHIHSRVLSRLERYWQQLPRTRSMPSRKDFDPAAIKDLLPSVFMVDVVEAPLRFRYRLIGTQVRELSQRDLTGRMVDETTYGESSDFIRFLFGTVVRRRAPVLAQGSAKWLDASSWKVVAVLLLPLSSDGDEVDIILGGINSDFHAREQPPSNRLLAVDDVEIIVDPHIEWDPS